MAANSASRLRARSAASLRIFGARSAVIHRSPAGPELRAKRRPKSGRLAGIGVIFTLPYPANVMDRDSGAIHLVIHDRQHRLSAHLHRPYAGGQSYMADEDALSVKCVPHLIVHGGARHRSFGVAGSEEPCATFIRDHQAIPGSLCLRYGHFGQVILVDSHPGFGIPVAPQVLNEPGLYTCHKTTGPLPCRA